MAIAIIRIKGQVNISGEMKDTLEMMRLYRKNYGTVIDNKPELTGMLKKVKDFVAWGEVTEEQKKKLMGKGKYFKLPHLKKAKTGKQDITKLII